MSSLRDLPAALAERPDAGSRFYMMRTARRTVGGERDSSSRSGEKQRWGTLNIRRRLHPSLLREAVPQGAQVITASLSTNHRSCSMPAMNPGTPLNIHRSKITSEAAAQKQLNHDQCSVRGAVK